MLYYALSLLDLPRERALMVGDSINDLEAGRNAGVPVVLLEGGYSERPVSELGADAVLPSFTGLPGWIAAADG
jgi:phosphoglycolate phosphatase